MTEGAAAPDLAADALAAALQGRPTRSYPALLSTEAVALAWARTDAPSGAVVVADYQVSPRGRGGFPWTVQPGRGLGFSLVLRPELPTEREGWVYSAAVNGLADALEREMAAAEVRITWPDEVRAGGGRIGALGAWVELGPDGVQWSVLNVLVPDVEPPRGPMLAAVADAVEARLAADPNAVLAVYRPRCATLGLRLRARMIPLGPAGPSVSGTAVDLLADGSLVIATDRGNRVAIRPHNLGVLEELT